MLYLSLQELGGGSECLDRVPDNLQQELQRISDGLIVVNYGYPALFDLGHSQSREARTHGSGQNHHTTCHSLLTAALIQVNHSAPAERSTYSSVITDGPRLPV
jgi:hypothetical protein